MEYSKLWIIYFLLIAFYYALGIIYKYKSLPFKGGIIAKLAFLIQPYIIYRLQINENISFCTKLMSFTLGSICIILGVFFLLKKGN
jgi:hypothetical protein